MVEYDRTYFWKRCNEAIIFIQISMNNCHNRKYHYNYPHACLPCQPSPPHACLTISSTSPRSPPPCDLYQGRLRKPSLSACLKMDENWISYLLLRSPTVWYSLLQYIYFNKQDSFSYKKWNFMVEHEITLTYWNIYVNIYFNI